MIKAKLFDVEMIDYHRPDGKFSMSGGVDYNQYGIVEQKFSTKLQYVAENDPAYTVMIGVDRALFHNFYALQRFKGVSVAWLMTSREDYPNIYKHCTGMFPHIDLFITDDKEFLDDHEHAVYVPSIENWKDNKSFEGYTTPEDWIYENILKDRHATILKEKMEKPDE